MNIHIEHIISGIMKVLKLLQSKTDEKVREYV